jgi:signal peptidase I
VFAAKGRSYAERKLEAAKHRRIAGIVLLYLASFVLITSLVFSARVMESASMAPAIREGDRLIIASFAAVRLLPRLPVSRGDVVLIDRASGGAGTNGTSALKAAFNGIVRTLTGGRAGVRDERAFVKRVAALPGDTVWMDGFLLRVRPAGEAYTLTEAELSKKSYEPRVPDLPSVWSEALPFAGTMKELTLGEDEYLVLSDDRADTNDSRTWGPLPASCLKGRAILIYWPPTRAISN